MNLIITGDSNSDIFHSIEIIFGITGPNKRWPADSRGRHKIQMSVISGINWTIPGWLLEIISDGNFQISHSLKAVCHSCQSYHGCGLSDLWPHFNLHTSIQCPSRLPHKPSDATEHTAQELQEFYWQWKSHFYCHSDKSGQFLVEKKISNISHQNRKISWLVFYCLF